MTTTIRGVSPRDAWPQALQSVARVLYETAQGRGVWKRTAVVGAYAGAVDGDVAFYLVRGPPALVKCESFSGQWRATVEGRDVDALLMLVEHDVGADDDWADAAAMAAMAAIQG